MEQPLKLTREQIVEQEMDPVYDFFVRAELADEHFSYKMIAEVYPRVIKTIRKYAQNYWSWFLVKESATRPYTFSCHGLADYPKQYFIDAHKPNQGQYFYHFAVAMQDAVVRAEEEKRKRAEARARAQQLHLPDISEEQETIIAQQDAAETLVPEQVLPEFVHIEKIEDDLEENGESSNEPSPAAGEAPIIQDEHPLLGEGPGATDHQPEDKVTEDELPTVSTPREEPQEVRAPASDIHQHERTAGVTTGKLVATAVCLVVLVGLAIWWIASKG